jgi:hypothetical protein
MYRKVICGLLALAASAAVADEPVVNLFETPGAKQDAASFVPAPEEITTDVNVSRKSGQDGRAKSSHRARREETLRIRRASSLSMCCGGQARRRERLWASR